jgi:dTDP-4-dehydrorhamnose 3,5-epimerase
VIPTELPAVKLIIPQVHRDGRGFFLESYQASRYHTAGLTAKFVQDNHSRSTQGVVRGLHYQLLPGQTKLVRAVVGEILDVVADLRRGSPTYGKWTAVHLSAENCHQLYVPVGFAHGFAVLSPVAEVEYKVDTYYDPAKERGVRYDDPTLGVKWPVASPVLSARDQALPLLADAQHDFVWQGQD